MVEESGVLGFESDDYRWIVIKVKDNMINGGIFTDIAQMSKRVGLTDRQLRTRLDQMNGLGRIKVNDYTITKMPYHKSKRGYIKDGNQ